MAVVLLALLAAILALLYYKATKNFSYWEKFGVKCLTPPTIQGAIKGAFLNGGIEMYNCHPGERYIGIIRLNSNAICIRDPEMIRLIFTKDFAYFHDRGNQFNEKRDVLSSHLFNLEGKKWRILRAKLTPTFTSGKLRAMFPFVKHCVDQMNDIVASSYADTPAGVDLNDILSRCTTDIILSCAFGVQGNCLKDKDDIYLQMVKKNFSNSTFQMLEHVFFVTFPFLENYFPPLKERRNISQFFLDAFAGTVREREKTGTRRNDFLDLLLDIYKNRKLADGKDESESDSFEFSYNVMVAQAFVFFVAGSETSSSAASFAIVELANNIHIQDRLRAEIDESIQQNGGLTYDGVMNMPYLDQVVSETLRRHPTVKVLVRKVTQPYRMPDDRVTLPVGMRVYVHVNGLHNDPQHFPDPHKFDPERFAPEAKQNRHKYVYIPFGEGPRICIGMRFALLQVKLALASLISQFELRPKPGIPYPPVISSKKLVTSFEHGASVLITRRKAS